MQHPEILEVNPRGLHLLLSAVCPEYRFGRLVLNLAFLARDDGDRTAWDPEDAEFLEAARKHLADWRSNHGQSEDVLRSNAVSAQV